MKKKLFIAIYITLIVMNVYYALLLLKMSSPTYVNYFESFKLFQLLIQGRIGSPGFRDFHAAPLKCAALRTFSNVGVYQK